MLENLETEMNTCAFACWSVACSRANLAALFASTLRRKSGANACRRGTKRGACFVQQIEESYDVTWNGNIPDMFVRV